MGWGRAAIDVDEVKRSANAMITREWAPRSQAMAALAANDARDEQPRSRERLGDRANACQRAQPCR